MVLASRPMPWKNSFSLSIASMTRVAGRLEGSVSVSLLPSAPYVFTPAEWLLPIVPKVVWRLSFDCRLQVQQPPPQKWFSQFRLDVPIRFKLEASSLYL